MDHRYKVGGYVKLAKLWERSKDAAVAYHSSYYAEKFKTDSDKAANIVWTFKHFWQIGNRAIRVAG